MKTAAFWQTIPKAETHVHLEGCVTPGLLRRLHRKHGGPWREWSVAAISRELAFTGFAGFLSVFRTICSAIRSEDDFALITRFLFQRLTREKIVYCEFFYTPAASVRFGLDPEKALAVILETATSEGARRGVGWRIILDNVRQFPPASFEQTLELALRFQRYGVAGIGMGGDEGAASLAPVATGFERARAAGLRIHLHTGETGNQEQALADLRLIRPHRIGHGLSLAGSAQALNLLLRDGIQIDICLTSNQKTGAASASREHPVFRLLAEGVAVTLGTDDPGIFRTTLNREYAIFSRLASGPADSVRIFGNQLGNVLLPGCARKTIEQAELVFPRH